MILIGYVHSLESAKTIHHYAKGRLKKGCYTKIVSRFQHLFTSRAMWLCQLLTLQALGKTIMPYGKLPAGISSEKSIMCRCLTGLAWKVWGLLLANGVQRPVRTTHPAPQTPLEFMVSATAKSMYSRIKPLNSGITPPNPRSFGCNRRS